MTQEARDRRNATARKKWESGRESKAEWFVRKKSRKSEYDVRYRSENREKKRESDKRWRSNNLLRARRNSKKWKLDHPEQHKAHARAAGLTYLKRHPEKNRHNVHRYRLRKLSAMVGDQNHTLRYMRSILSAEFVDCCYCGTRMLTTSKSRITFDHVIPLTRGGLHTPDNLRPSCLPCNSSKGNKLLVEWLQ